MESGKKMGKIHNENCTFLLLRDTLQNKGHFYFKVAINISIKDHFEAMVVSLESKSNLKIKKKLSKLQRENK